MKPGRTIKVHGAREHNLQNVDLEIPKRSLVVFTGPSGSGKSSLAFDTIYSEGRRRYVESLSAYARQFLEQIEKPDFDEILGLSPTISIDQKTTANNPRSTVGTVTEIYDYIRILYARLGTQHCPSCGDEVTSIAQDAIVDEVLALPDATRFMLLAPVVRNRKGEHRDLFAKLRLAGYVRARVDGELVELDGLEKVALQKRHDIEVVVDRLIARDTEAHRQRVYDGVDAALRLGKGAVIVRLVPKAGDGTETLYSKNRGCAKCGLSFPDLTHQSFSFNSPVGMCKTCRGIGWSRSVGPELLTADVSRSVMEGAIAAIGPAPGRRGSKRLENIFDVASIFVQIQAYADQAGFDLEAPFQDLPESVQTGLIAGAKPYPGVAELVRREQSAARKQSAREHFAEFMVRSVCTACDGSRLSPASAAVSFQGRSIVEVCGEQIDVVRGFFDGMDLSGREAQIGEDVTQEISSRLRFLEEVGLGYLHLNRSADTLSGGESQRIRLASQLGSELSGVLYVLDEPSIGLHQRDNVRLLATLNALRDRGNSVIVVEHDRETMEQADFIVDFGPGAGREGGFIVVAGDPDAVRGAPQSITGDYLAGRRALETPVQRRPLEGPAVVIEGATENNLKGVDARFPLGCFVCVTGVSGAGKSTLVNDILFPAVASRVLKKHRTIGGHASIEGLELIDKVIEIDQSPIGRSPRSNPATYTKVFDQIRKAFAMLPESKVQGYKPGRFSFNVKGGRCEGCHGAGVQRVEMNFLADVFVPCDVCFGARFNPPTLRVKYRGHTISDVLGMTIREAYGLFEMHPKIARVLKTMLDVGLDYVQLGQPSPTLSGGEAQRVKLSRELAKRATGKTLYILDEPSTGLHFDDIAKLLKVIDKLVDSGNTVVMIEHNLDIIKAADFLIDLGPEGGSEGGRLVAAGTPEEVATSPTSHTAKFLREVL